MIKRLFTSNRWWLWIHLFVTFALFVQTERALANARIPVDSRISPWQSVGEINVDGKKRCTGALIGEQTVLTAAHCLWDHDTDRFYPPTLIHFVAGASPRSYQGHSHAISMVVDPLYRYRVPPLVRDLDKDWALLRLASPLGKTLGYLPVIFEPLNPLSDRFVVVGYALQQAFQLSQTTPCLGALMKRRSLIRHHCAVAIGDSGGPLLKLIPTNDHSPATYAITGLQVAILTDQKNAEHWGAAIAMTHLQTQILATMAIKRH